MSDWFIVPGIQNLDQTDFHVFQVMFEHLVICVDTVCDGIGKKRGFFLSVTQHSTAVNYMFGLAEWDMRQKYDRLKLYH